MIINFLVVVEVDGVVAECAEVEVSVNGLPIVVAGVAYVFKPFVAQELAEGVESVDVLELLKHMEFSCGFNKPA